MALAPMEDQAILPWMAPSAYLKHNQNVPGKIVQIMQNQTLHRTLGTLHVMSILMKQQKNKFEENDENSLVAADQVPMSNITTMLQSNG